MGARGSLGQVDALWRYPVKSLRGEQLEELDVAARGVEGDRAYGVMDRATRTVLSAKREGRLFEAGASFRDGEVAITLPDGRAYGRGTALDEALSHWLGREVALVEAATFGAATFQIPEDFERDDSALLSWEGVEGSFVDESELHLLSTGDLAALAGERPDLHWDARRFRPNLVLAGDPLDGLEPGDVLAVGATRWEITKGCSRCVMTTRPQPGGLARELDVLRHVARRHDGVVGWRARVVHAGRVRRGDPVELLAARTA